MTDAAGAAEGGGFARSLRRFGARVGRGLAGRMPEGAPPRALAALWGWRASILIVPALGLAFPFLVEAIHARLLASIEGPSDPFELMLFLVAGVPALVGGTFALVLLVTFGPIASVALAVALAHGLGRCLETARAQRRLSGLAPLWVAGAGGVPIAMLLAIVAPLLAVLALVPLGAAILSTERRARARAAPRTGTRACRACGRPLPPHVAGACPECVDGPRVK